MHQKEDTFGGIASSIFDVMCFIQNDLCPMNTMQRRAFEVGERLLLAFAFLGGEDRFFIDFRDCLD